MADPRTGSSRPRTPGLVNIAVVTVMVVLVAAVAFTARQQPPPTIAEFAPQAVEQIEESLPEQAQAPGSAPGDGDEIEEPEVAESPTETESPPETADDEPDADPTESEPPVEQARVRRCVGDPPRQTEDPQSPPCVPYFDGDNGGATHQGVTRDEIRVAVPLQSFGGAMPDQIQLLIDHFNRRYEFYGRKLVPEFFEPTGGTFAQPNPPDMIADAVMVDEEIQAFASLGYADRKGSEHHYYDELARRGVVSSAYRAETTATDDGYRRFAPHEWNFMPTIGTMLTGLGDMVCRTLSGMPPQGGGAQGGGQGPPDPLGGAEQEEGSDDRVFGVIHLRTPDGETPPIRILETALAGCDVTLAAKHEDDADAPNGTNAVLRMQDAGVTSVIYLGDPGPLRADYMNAATNQGYFPEWIVSSYIDLDTENAFQPGNASPEQSQNLLGISFRDKLLPRQNMPWYWAVKEGDPQADPSGGLYYPMMARYHQLLQLASGIQLAGPELTPDAFEQGLQQADFPNPGAGGPPAYQAAVDYSGRHTPSDSGMLWYYSPRDSGIVDPGVPGAICYVNDGTRYRVGGFPAGPQPFFEDPCR